MKSHWRGRATLRTACASVFATLAMSAAPAFADVTATFDIDGNVGVACGTAFPGQICKGEDWSSLYSCSSSGCTQNTPQSGNNATLIAAPLLRSTTADKIFTSGGSKDAKNLNMWRWTTGSVPDKDELVAGYASLYTAGSGKQLYFAANRYAVNGDAMIGTWFFQNTVLTKDDGTFVDYKGNPATHKIGDMLILSDFTNGGGRTKIQVYRVNAIGPATCPAGSMMTSAGVGEVCLEMVVEGESGSAGACNEAGTYAAKSACAATNPVSTASLDPTFQPKSGAPGYYPAVGFFEGGLDLAAIGASGSCFSTVLMETRSSSSLDAVLKDFFLGAFQDCSATVKTEIHSAADNSDADLQGGAVNPGVPLHDLAIVKANGTGNPIPTGTVTFKLFAQTGCTGDSTSETVSLVSGMLDARASSTAIASALPPGYSYLVTYNGDGLYDPVTAECESITVNKGNPTLVTTPSAGGYVGVALSDSAVLAGGLNNPSGTITFKLFDPDSPTCAATTERFAWTTPVSGNGTYVTAPPPFATDKPGTWRWTADYSGDPSNNPASSGCDKELVVVTKGSPTLVTTPSAGGVIGVALTDSAVLAGGVNTPTGSIVFKLFDPDSPTCAAGTHRATWTTNVSGNGTYVTAPPTFVTDKAGTWRWTADYSGDIANYPASSGCDKELVVVDKATPTLGTAPKISVVNNDSATLAGLKGATIGGTLTFKLFQNADCSGTEIFKQDVAVTGNATYATNNATAILVTADTQFRWTVGYSGDSNNNAATSACSAESVVIDVTP